MSDKVVITGAGVVSPFGTSREKLFQSLLDKKNGLRKITAFDPSTCNCEIAGEVDNELINVRQAVPKNHRKAIKLMCRDIQFSVVAAKEALIDAKIQTISTQEDPTINPNRVGCHIGAGFISADLNELTNAQFVSKTKENTLDLKDWGQNGMKHLTPLWLLKYLPNMLACHVTIIHDCRGPSNTITCSEASSGLSIAESVRCIQRGSADACLSGGIESKINLMAYFRKDRNNELLKSNQTSTLPEPYGSTNGTVLGEGGAILTIESEKVAQERNAKPLGEIAGIGSSQSFCEHPLSVDPTSIQYAVEAALSMADINSQSVDAILPLGSGINSIDNSEVSGLKNVFGKNLKNIPIYSYIPNIGNCGAGHGGIGHSIAVSIINTQMIPPSLTTNKNKEILLSNETIHKNINNLLILSPSLGGQISTTIVRKIT